MTKTVHFYNVFIKKDNIYTSLNVCEFLTQVMLLDEADKFVDKSFGSYSLIEMLNPNNNPNNNPLDRLVGFASYRDKKTIYWA